MKPDNQNHESQTPPGPLPGKGMHPDHLSKRRQTKRFPSGLVWGVIFVAALLIVGLLPRLRQSHKLELQDAVLADSAIPVNVVKAYQGPSVSELSLPSNMQAIEETPIYARTSGYIHQLFVDFGSRVKQGQTLATIESPDVDQELSAAQADASKSQASGEQAIADVSRLQANVAQAQAQVAGSQSDLLAAKAGVAHTTAKLTEAKGAASEAQAELLRSQRLLEGKKADLARANTRMVLARKTYKRWQQLALGGAVSGQDLDEAEAGYEASQSTVTSAQADVQSAEASVTAAQADLRSRAGDVEAAQADVSSSQQRVDAARSLVTSSKENVNAVRAGVTAGQASARAAQSTVQASEANVRRVAALQSFENVTAPFSGVITARNVDVGSLINAGGGSGAGASDPTSTVTHSGLFGLARTDVLRVQVNVPQSAVSLIKPGQTALIKVQEYPNRLFTGRIFDTAGALDETSRTLLVEVRLQNPDLTLKPGMYAEVVFQLRHPKPILRIAANTLIINGKGTRVAIVDKDSKIEYRTVELGQDLGKEVEILSGLDGSEQVVSNPTDELTEGAKVKVVPAEAN